jgi:hypothetical protein
MDEVPLALNVLFVGDYFTMITTVVLDEKLRRPGEPDEDYAVRLASEFMLGYYGWDVAARSTQIGVMSDEYEDG